METQFTGCDSQGPVRLTEQLLGNGATGLAVLAPHGGKIEVGTDDQATSVFKALAQNGKPVRAWIARGFNPKGADPASSCTGSSLPNNLHPPNTAMWRGSAATRPLAPALAAARAYVVERRDESLGQVDVWSTQLRVERIRRHEQRPGAALGGLLVVVGRTHLARVDGVAAEARHGDEAAFGVVGLEDLDVRGVADALGGQGGDAVTVDDGAHTGCSPRGARLAPGGRARRVGRTGSGPQRKPRRRGRRDPPPRRRWQPMGRVGP